MQNHATTGAWSFDGFARLPFSGSANGPKGLRQSRPHRKSIFKRAPVWGLLLFRQSLHQLTLTSLTISPSPASVTTACRTQVDHYCNNHPDDCNAVPLSTIIVDDYTIPERSYREENKAQYRNQDTVENTIKPIRKEPEHDNHDSWKEKRYDRNNTAHRLENFSGR